MDLQAELDALRAEINSLRGTADPHGRSPMKPRQLTNLTLLPTKDDPRPTFIWSAESPRDVDVSRGTEYPKLMWHRDTNEEITVHSAAEELQKAELYTVDPPSAPVAIDPMESLQEALERLSPEERAAVLEGQKKSRIEVLQAQLSQLSPDDLAALFAGQMPVKRKPGRPRKVDAA